VPEQATRPEARRLQIYIDGAWREGAAGGRFESVDPFSGEVWATAVDGDAADVDAAVAAAREAFDSGPWATMGGAERGAALRRLADLLRRDADHLADLESRDNGKVLREMAGQMAALPKWFDYFAGLADKVAGRTLQPDKADHFVYTREEPVGVVGAIVPWNSPLLLTSWKIAPALAVGCTIVLKPSELTPASALALAALFDEAGFPPGVFNVVTGDGPEVGEALARHPGVDKLSFTGSTKVGIEVGRAGLGHMARLSLELGGKSAQIVLDDADVEAAANGVIAGIFAAGGQTCIAGSRVYAHEDIYEELLDRVVARAGTIVLGDPRDPLTEMGPLASARQQRTVGDFVKGALSGGAEVRCGGGVPKGLPGFFFEPTVLSDVDPASHVAQEEIFGPVAIVTPVASDAEALRLANGTRYGLAASVWGGSVGRVHRLAHRLQAATVYLNDYRLVDPGVPFGGVKMSGIGRESGPGAISEFTETKAIWVHTADATRDPFTLG
jgi:acyl-CoA reductase-like NAD-dependent aldehyde dehydrogenase